MKEWAKEFYKGPGWKHTRNAYMKAHRGLCEICLSKGLIVPAEIVHHKIWLTPENINNPNVSLNWDNLQCVCRECHSKIHESHNKKNLRYRVDECGRVICV